MTIKWRRLIKMSKLHSILKLQEMSPYEIAMLIRNDHPQIIAQICFFMDDKITSDVLSNFSERLRNDIILRISTLTDIDKYWLLKLDESLMETINNTTSRYVYQKGLEKSADILKLCDPSYQIPILSNISEYDPELCDALQNQMMLFDDIFNLSSEDLSSLLSAVELEDFTIALKGIDKHKINKLLTSLPDEQSKTLSTKISELSSVKHRISHIISNRSETLKSLRVLIDEDKITSINNEWI